jgi:hypothetical protein
MTNGTLENKFNKIIYDSNFFTVFAYVLLGISKLFEIYFLIYLPIIFFLVSFFLAMRALKILLTIRRYNKKFFKEKLIYMAVMLISLLLFIFIYMIKLNINF